MSVFMLCEQAIGLVRGKRLILSSTEKSYLEALNYEGLTAEHSQDEAVVCALHFGRVRDRLLQVYPWTFARRSAEVPAGGFLPSDCMNVLCVLVDGMPVEYETTAGRLNTTASAEVHYTAKITDTEQWSAIFKDVFVYSLAIEICSAVTGKPEYVQLLEQKAQELITRAKQNGAIQSETRITLRQEIFNRAIGLSRGQRSIKPTSEAATQQGIDNAGIPEWRAEAEIKACMRAYEGIRDRLLSGYPWTFARKSATVTGGNLPADLVTVLAVFVDGVPQEWELLSGKLNITAQAEVQYTAKVTDMDKWDAIFREVFVYLLGSEICLAVTGSLEGATLLEQKAQEIISRGYQTGAIKAETRITLKEELYNRAVILSRGQRSIKETSTAALTQGTDNAGFVNDRMTAEYQVCEHSGENVRDRLLELYPWLFARKTALLSERITAVGGWEYGYKLPPDCLKVLAVIGSGNALDYENIGENVYTGEEAGSVRYTGLVEEAEKWPGSFRDLFTYQLAIEVVYATTGNVQVIQMLEQKSFQVIQFAYNSGLIQNETKLPASDELYGRAINIAHGSEEADENITARNAREYSVCKNSAGYIRDRLLQSHPWKFARKKANITNGSLPGDWLATLAVTVDGKPIDDDVLPTRCELTYTAKITDINKWDAIFKDAFCYLLAGEIIRSVKGNAELAQSTEAKADEYIRKGYELGIIKAETKLTLKDEIFSRAINLAHGQRLTSPTSEQSYAMGLDYTGNPNWRNEAEYQACIRSAETIRDKLLELHPWIFARKSAQLQPSAENITGWEYGYDLPEDCLTVLTVLTECGNPEDYEVAGMRIYANAEEITIRYTAKVTEYSKWPSTFTDAYVYILACEVLTATIPLGEALQNMVAYLKRECENAISEGYRIGIIRAETNITLKDELCGRAVGLLLGLSGDEKLVPEIKTQAYSAIRRAYDSVRDKLLQMYAWTFARKTTSLPSKANKIYGWRYTFELPPDCLRVNSVIAHDRRDDYEADIECMRLSEFPQNVEIIEYEVSGSELYANRENVHVRYTARITDKDRWPPLFREALIYCLASEAALNVPVRAEIHKILMEREKQAVETATANGVIREESRLPLQHESTRTGLLNRQYLDYSGLATIPCGYGGCRNADEFFGWRD